MDFFSPSQMEEEEHPLLPATSTDAVEAPRTRSRLVGIVFGAILVISSCLSITSMVVEDFFAIDVEPLKVRHPSSSKSLEHVKLRARVTISGLRVADPDGENNLLFPFVAGDRRLDNSFFIRFREYIVSMDYTAKAWMAVQWLIWTSCVLQLIAVALQLAFRTIPTTLSFKAGSTLRDSWKSALPVWFVLFSGFCGLVGLIVANSSIQSTATRLAIFAIREKSDDLTWQEFTTALDGEQPRLYLMNTLKSLGHWFVKDSGCRWSISSYLILASVILTLSAFVFVFYLDTRSVRSELQLTNDSAKIRIESELKRLPRHSRVLPIWVSLILFLAANVITKLAGRSVNNNGRQLNRLPWTASAMPPHGRIVRDVINDHTGFFWLQPPEIVDGSFLIWVPLVAVVNIGSVHRIGLMSKMIEVLSYIFILRAASIYSTVMPSAMTLVQRPICYDDEEMSWGGMWTTSNYCNDMIFSGHSSSTIVGACVLMFMLIYGPYRRKAISIGFIVVFATFSLSVVLLGRYHYTADIILAAVICFLVCLIHSPAWKVFFYFRRYELAAGSVSGIERIAGELERVSIEVEVLSKSNKIDFDKSEWQSMEQRVEKVRQYLELIYTS